MKPLFAIRHKPTGHYLPDPDRIQWRKSHVEPVDCSGEINPRLFHTELSAKRALSAWLQGKWKADMYWESEGWEYPSYQVQDVPVPTAVPHRVKEEMEVVAFNLMEIL